MTSIVRALVLPPDVSRFERAHLARMNRIALFFFFAHVPVFTAVAFFNGTGALVASVATVFACVGPLLAMRWFHNPRHTSLVFGVTAMLMGAILVHFGRGLWTIEMHFYFFVALALLAVFGNPMVVLIAALTVAVHHALGWFLSPESIFNYEAPLSSVLLHAGFVVLESVAACFVARSFFDNVIGLERIVGERTRALDDRNRDMQLVFDHVHQGFLTASISGALSVQHSRAAASWLGAPTAGEPLWAYFGKTDAAFGRWLEVGWSMLVDDVMPRDVALAQLPSRLTSGRATLEVSYQPVEGSSGQLESVLVLVSDISERLVREETEAIQRETVSTFERLTRDRAGFLDFFSEAKRLVDALSSDDGEATPDEQVRQLHTLKGNCAVFGVTSVSARLHLLETAVLERGGPLLSSERETIARSWADASARMLRFLDAGTANQIVLEEADYLAILRAIDTGAAPGEVRRLIESWKDERVAARLERLAAQTRQLAAKLGKDPLEVSVDGGDLRFPRDQYGALWGALVHLVRNAVDHGIEQPAERRARNKGSPRLSLSSERTRDGWRLSVRDDGAGIDWSRIRSRAEQLGLPASSPEQLTAALFADGVSTKGEVTDVSGRGVGLAAVRAEVLALGGAVHVETVLGEGTTFSLELPWPEPAAARLAAA